MFFQDITSKQAEAISGGYWIRPRNSYSHIGFAPSHLSYGANFVTYGNDNYKGNYQTTFNVGGGSFNTTTTTGNGGGHGGGNHDD